MAGQLLALQVVAAALQAPEDTLFYELLIFGFKTTAIIKSRLFKAILCLNLWKRLKGMIGSLRDSRKIRRVSAALWIDTVGDSCNFVSQLSLIENSCYLGQASVQPISQLQDLTSQPRLRRMVIKVYLG